MFSTNRDYIIDGFLEIIKTWRFFWIVFSVNWNKNTTNQTSLLLEWERNRLVFWAWVQAALNQPGPLDEVWTYCICCLRSFDRDGQERVSLFVSSCLQRGSAFSFLFVWIWKAGRDCRPPEPNLLFSFETWFCALFSLLLAWPSTVDGYAESIGWLAANWLVDTWVQHNSEHDSPCWSWIIVALYMVWFGWCCCCWCLLSIQYLTCCVLWINSSA